MSFDQSRFVWVVVSSMMLHVIPFVLVGLFFKLNHLVHCHTWILMKCLKLISQ